VGLNQRWHYFSSRSLGGSTGGGQSLLSVVALFGILQCYKMTLILLFAMFCILVENLLEILPPVGPG